jgi:DNA-binding MarR family transcriptional regulator
MKEETKEKRKETNSAAVINAVRKFARRGDKEIGILAIAREAGVSVPVVTRTLIDLKDRGLVTVDLLPVRGRRFNVELTPKGRGSDLTLWRTEE